MQGGEPPTAGGDAGPARIGQRPGLRPPARVGRRPLHHQFGNFFGSEIVGHRIVRVPLGPGGVAGAVNVILGVTPLDLTFGPPGPACSRRPGSGSDPVGETALTRAGPERATRFDSRPRSNSRCTSHIGCGEAASLRCRAPALTVDDWVRSGWLSAGSCLMESGHCNDGHPVRPGRRVPTAEHTTG